MSVREEILTYFKTRRSTPKQFLREPAPSEKELEEILTIASRVPDHGKLSPWRFIIYQGKAREKVGENLANILKEREPNIDKERLEIEKKQFFPAPITIAVIFSPKENGKIPIKEQLLSAGAAALNILHAANILGYGAHWVSRWFAYDEQASKMLGAREGEQFIAFIHIGTAEKKVEDRPRPKLEQIISYWQG